MKGLILFLALASSLSFGQAWSGILPANRAIDWTTAGVVGGIPSGSWANCTTAACNTAFSNPTVANVNSACSGAPDSTVVRIPAGSFTWASSVHCNRNNVALRGAGPTQTFITLSGGANILLGNGTGGQGSVPGGLGSTTFSTYTQGSTVITVASTTGLSAGQVVALMEQNPAYVQPIGNEGNQNALFCLSPLNFFGCSANSALELVQIASVGSGQITLSAPGLKQTYTSGLVPTLVYWNKSETFSGLGLENINVAAGTSDFAVAMTFCNGCWVKNVVVTNSHRAGIYSFLSYGDEIRDSYVSASNTAGAPTEYGIELDRSNMTKAENNIEYGVTSPFVTESACGNVIAYNYTLRTPSDNVFPGIDTHRSHECNLLYEGNVSVNINFDFVHGSGGQSTSFRNRLSGTEPNATNYRTPVVLAAFQRYMNLVANVIGDPTFHTQYVCNNSNVLGSDNFIYDLGFNFNCENGSLVNYDTGTETTLMRWGNWDAVTYCTNGGHSGQACGATGSNGVRYCTGSGSGNPACTASETASTDPTFPGLASPLQTFPASFYNGSVAAQPSCGTGLSFWKNPNTGACPVYPPIGPDVTCATNCISNTASHAAMVPAQLCYNNTAKDANGFLTAFDAAACYANDPLLSSPTTGTQGTITIKGNIITQ